MFLHVRLQLIASHAWTYTVFGLRWSTRPWIVSVVIQAAILWIIVESQICIFSIHFSIPFFIHLNLPSCQYHCILIAKDHLTWFLIIFLCLLFDLDFSHLAAESCHFPQLLQLSAAILWNSMLQVSTGKTSHMGKSEMMWTWFVSYWLEQIHLKRLRSKVSKWKSTVESHGDRTLFLVTWRFIWPFLNFGRQINTCTWLHKPNSNIHSS